jgi:uncharacterized Zn-binding protein involved in type VI secretion
MPGADAARLGDPITTGHACTANSTIDTTGNLQSTVFINNIIAAVLGDPIKVHDILVNGACKPHSATVVGSSEKVKFQGYYAARVGDAADAGVITEGSPDVIIG